MPKAKLDNAYEILLDYGYIEPGVSDRVYWEALKQATLDFQEENNVEYFDIVRAEEKELRDKVVPKIKKTKISAEAFKKGTSQDIKPNTEVTSLTIRKPKTDITPKDITPETPEEEPVVEPKQPSLGEGFKNILNSIAGSTESIKNLLLGQQKADQQAAKDARKSREDSKRKVKEKKIESRVFDGLKKVGEKVIAPVKGLLGQIWDFIKTLFLSAVVGKLIKWIQNPKNQKKVKSVFRFIKDWWPALLAGWLLFGTGIGSLITGTVAAIAGFIPVLTGLLVPLAAFAASPIGLAVLATGGIAAFLATQKNKTDKAVDESVKTQGRDKTVSDLKEEDANKNIFQKAGGFITGENQERKEQIQRIQTGTEKRYGFFGELPQPAKFNKGGSVPGQGNTDTVPAMLTPGEFVLTKEATEKYGTDTLEGMNAAASSGKKETSGTGRLIGSTIGGFTGAAVGFFADTPVSPAADIALGIAGSAAGGEIGDNIERKITGKGDKTTNNNVKSYNNGGLVTNNNVKSYNNGGLVTNNNVKSYNNGGLVTNNNVTNAAQSFIHGGLVQYLNDGGTVIKTSENATLKRGQVVSGNMNQSDAEKLKQQIALEDAEFDAIQIYGFDSPEHNEIKKQILILQGTPADAIYTDRKGNIKVKGYSTYSGEKRRSISNKSQKNPANFLQPQGFESKKGGGLGRLIGGIADIATLGMFDFDNKSGGGLLRKVVGGTADALTGNRWDFDNQGKPEVKSEPPKISGKLKSADITPPVVGGAAGQSNITTMNMNESGIPIPIGGDDQAVPELPNFSPIAMRSRDKIKTLGIMV